jgi:hypothetical protein
MWNRISYGLVATSGILVSIVIYQSFFNQKQSLPNLQISPTINYPAEIQLGEHEIGATAISPITISNSGSQELILSNITTTCTCAGLEREEGGNYTRMNQIVIPPKSQSPFVIRQSVRGVPVGSQSINTVYFETNDPNHPAGAIRISISRVKGGVHPVPSSVSVGSVAVGTPVTRTIEIRDDALKPRQIAQLISSTPNRISIRLIPVDSNLPQEKHPEGTLIAKAEVTVDTSKPAVLNDWISIVLADTDREPDAVKVVGNILDPIELSPSELTFPRRSSGGLIYKASFICRSTLEKDFQLIASNVPAGVNLENKDDTERRKTHIVNISIEPQTKPGIYSVEFLAKFDNDKTIPLKFAISLSKPEGKP